ncbi:MAG: YybS family protein [Selenomonadaceae bacterium]|nr:YybS family protein [Selenomonadaceae bacterium]
MSYNGYSKGGLTPLTEGAMLAAITTILGVMAVYLPIIGIVAAFFWMIPIVVLCVRHGMRYALLALTVVGVMLSLFVTPIMSLKMMASYGFLALALGFGFRRGWPAVKLFTATVLGSLVGKILLFGMLILMQVNPMEIQLEGFTEAFDSTFKLYEEMGMDEASLEEARASIDESMKLVGLLTPCIFFLVAFLDGAVTYWAGGKVLGRLGVQSPTFPPFKEWRLPAVCPYLLGFALIGMYWGSVHEIPRLYEISLNINVLAMMAGIVQGMSLVFYAADRFQLSRMWRTFIIIFILLNGFFAQMLAFTGLLDMIFDYRRRFGGGR